jgi:hypothetical protein
MPSCDPQKGGGRRRAMWRLSARAWAPRVWCSPTGGKERLCPASEKRWRAQIEYEIEGGRAGTSLTSRAGEEPRRGSKSYCLATYGHSPQISARSPHHLTRFLLDVHLTFVRLTLLPPSSTLMAIAGWIQRQELIRGEQGP